MDFQSKFKTGIEDKTEKRFENLAIIRDKKKEAKRIRIVRKINTSQQQQQQQQPNKWSRLDDDAEGKNFRGSLEGLIFVQNFLETNYNNKQELDAHMLKLFPSIMDEQCNELEYIIDCLNPDKGPEFNTRSIQCLYILSQAEFELVLSFAANLFKSGKFLTFATRHIEKGTPIVLDVWQTVSNAAAICHETKIIVMESAICKVHFPIFYNNKIKDQRSEHIIYSFIGSIICTGGRQLPEDGFIKAVWLNMVVKLKQLNPIVRRDFNLDDNVDQAIMTSILYTMYHLANMAPDLFFKDLIRVGEEKCGLLTFLHKFIKIASLDFLYYTITFLFHSLCVEPQAVTKLVTPEIVQVISVHCENPRSKIATIAIKWMRTYCSISFETLDIALDTKSLAPIINTIRNGNRYAKQIYICIDLIMGIAELAMKHLQLMDKKTEYIMDFLIFESQIIRNTSHFLKRDDNKMTCRILQLWLNLMTYSRDFILDQIIKCGAMNKVESLAYSNHTEICKLASKIQGIYDIRQPTNEEENLTASMPMEFDF